MEFDPDFLAQFQPRPMFWITDYIGSSAVDDVHEPGVVVIDVRDLNDGTNPPGPIWLKIRAALEVLKLGNKVCIRCTAGISRSNSIAAAVLSLHDGIPYKKALEKVREKVPRAWPNPLMVRSTLRAINEFTPHSYYPTGKKNETSINIQSRGEITTINEVPHLQLLKTQVEDGVFFVDRCCTRNFEIRAVGLVKGRLIAGKKTGEIVKRGSLAFDEDGLACYDSEFCGKRVKEYDRLFLGNYQMFQAWGRRHEALIESIRPILLGKNRRIRQLYTEYKTKNFPRIVAEAEGRMKIAEYSNIEPCYEDRCLVEAASKTSRVRGHMRKDDSDLFRLWYVDYIKSKGYEKKLKDTCTLYETDIKKILSMEINLLKRNGFRMIRKPKIPKELKKLEGKVSTPNLGVLTSS